MAKQGEIEYLSKIGEHGIRHLVRKPFSDPDCARYLMEIGAVMALLPPLPARVLDVGCGGGWTSLFFARRGYDVVGVDIAAAMIQHAEACRDREGVDNLDFVVSDYESLPFVEEFDAAVFFDALHHAVDEEAALRQVYRALKPGGVCITSEPGKGHAQSPASVEAMQKYQTTEKDMPPQRILAAGRRVGFREFRVYPHAAHLGDATYNYSGRWLRHLARKSSWLRKLASLQSLVRLHLFAAWNTGIVVLVK